MARFALVDEHGVVVNVVEVAEATVPNDEEEGGAMLLLSEREHALHLYRSDYGVIALDGAAAEPGWRMAKGGRLVAPPPRGPVEADPALLPLGLRERAALIMAGDPAGQDGFTPAELQQIAAAAVISIAGMPPASDDADPEEAPA